MSSTPLIIDPSPPPYTTAQKYVTMVSTLDKALIASTFLAGDKTKYRKFMKRVSESHHTSPPISDACIRSATVETVGGFSKSFDLLEFL